VSENGPSHLAQQEIEISPLMIRRDNPPEPRECRLACESMLEPFSLGLSSSMLI